MKKVLLAIAVLLSVSAFAFDTIPFQLGLWAPRVQMVPDDINVAGLKLNLVYGGNKNITGIDIGFASTGENVSALQLNLILNQANEQFSGVQLALVNQSECSEWLSLGVMNVTADRARGIQFGVINSAREMRGVQLGLVNYSEIMTGVQLGLANIIRESPVIFFPFINFCF